MEERTNSTDKYAKKMLFEIADRLLLIWRMNHLTAISIDFAQTIGVIVLFGVAAYAINEMLLRVEKVQIKIEDWIGCSWSTNQVAEGNAPVFLFLLKAPKNTLIVARQYAIMLPLARNFFHSLDYWLSHFFN